MGFKTIRDQQGQALIFITLAFVVLAMFIGLVVDGGRGYLMRERLRKIVDAAALAGAKAMAGAATIPEAIANASVAACDSARINGLNPDECGTSGTKIQITVGDVTNPDGTTQLGVIATGTDSARTFFMSLGALIGCTTCKEINVGAVGQAAPDTLADVALVLDDTGTMKCEPTRGFSGSNCPIEQAKAGASLLVDMLLADPNSHARIAVVPFRGCYANDRNNPSFGLNEFPPSEQGCIKFSEIVGLTNDATTIKTSINNHRGAGGFPGTNVCLGMHEARKQLFGDSNRAIARKIMVILTDGDQTYVNGAQGGTPNQGDPTPVPYPTSAYAVGSGQSGDMISGICSSITNKPGDATEFGDDYDRAITELDQKAFAKATSLKRPDGDNIEIYVLRFAYPMNDDALSSGDPPGSCDPSLISVVLSDRGQSQNSSNDLRDKNLSRCLASNTAVGDAFAKKPNDHYFYAASVADIRNQFQAIAQDILRKRRLVG